MSRESVASNLSISSACAGLIFCRALRTSNHSHRSTSGKVSQRPEPRGHSARMTLLLARLGSASPSHAQACTSLPAFWRTLPSGRKGPSGRTAVSSSNSRIAATRGSSPSFNRPFGTVQEPRSRSLQKGPPGWARKTSVSPPERRNRSSPALTFERFAIRERLVEAAAACTAHRAGGVARLRVVPSPPNGQSIGGGDCRLLASRSRYLTNSLRRDSTTGQGSSQYLLVMVTATACPAMRYSPPTMSCEKRPDCSPPTRVAPFSLATLLALASSEGGSTVVRMMKVLAAIFSLPHSRRCYSGKTSRVPGT